MVLLLLVVLTTTTATIFDQSAEGVDMTIALRNQSVAQSRAVLGAQRVLAEFRDPALYPQWNNVELLPPCLRNGAPCTTQNVMQNSCDTAPCRVAIAGSNIDGGLFDYGTALDLDLPDGGGGGSQFAAYVYNAGTAARPRYMVLSVGYRGYYILPDDGGSDSVGRRYESVVSMEITLPAAASDDAPVEGYSF